MYDGPGLAAANDALWRAIAGDLRARGVAGVPPALDRNRAPEEIWDDPRLLLAQTCGYPFATRWRGRLRYVATPRYAAPGCAGATHRSLFVARSDDPAASLAAFRGRVAAINDAASNTGANLLRAAVAPLAVEGRFFGAVIGTGSHRGSAAAVADGRADLAAIDAVTFALLPAGETARLRVVARSRLVPALPLVTAASAGDGLVDLLRDALRRAAGDPALADARAALRIEGFEVLAPDAYDAVLGIEADARRAGYPVLA